jgi:phosphoribosyl-AMP cyclohydrolase / phosphoribosyl-ATP pyrophosphohydrolase
MIVPSIDILGGRAVQLRGGDPEALEVDAGDPAAVAERFSRAGPLAVIDLDAALGRGDNKEIIKDLCRRHECRVGGGLRSVEAALDMLDAGAAQVILGTAARPDILQALPRERVVAAVDARHDEVVVEGWTKGTGDGLLQRVAALAPMVGGFLVTFVEREGQMKGTDLERAREVVEAAGGQPVTVAGGITQPGEVAALDELGADAQLGMAVYTGRLRLVDALWACLRPNERGWMPTVVSDEHGVALGLAWSDLESLHHGLETGEGAYHSRSRGELWVKGRTSGATQRLLRVRADCDRDALHFTVEQAGSFCHLDTRTCWGDDRGLFSLERRIRARRDEAPAASYTRRLFEEPGLLDAKLLEEAKELAGAEGFEQVVHETADVLYFVMVRAAQAGVSLADVERELGRRSRRVRRRPGDRKDQ